jgi:tRNA dimethylallyltransferase
MPGALHSAEGPVLVLAGPTASGKTALAEQLAQTLPLRLISADSQQIYRGLDIGTCKPGPATRGQWALIDVADLAPGPEAPFSAGAYCRLAAAECREAWERGRIPLLCGGTGLYLKALLEGLVELPEIPARLRAGLQARLDKEGLEAMVGRLEAVDPGLAATVDRRNPRRVLRGLEVFEATGSPLSQWQSMATRPSLRASEILWMDLDPGSKILDARLVQRVDACLAQGWLEEVRGLALRHGDEALRRCAAIGYPELLDHLRGRLGMAQAREAIISRTRRYARRQRTWFKAVPGMHQSADPAALASLAAHFIGGTA